MVQDICCIIKYRISKVAGKLDQPDICRFNTGKTCCLNNWIRMRESNLDL